MLFDLIKALDNPYQATTGRVKTALLGKDKGLYDVSCTFVNVKDTLWNNDDNPEIHRLETITGSIDFVMRALQGSAGVAVNLSDLRPSGSLVGDNGVSSGPAAFLVNYSAANQSVRKGGSIYKNGAVVVYLDAMHPDFEEFINIDKDLVPWVKRATYITDEVFNHPELVNLILAKMQEGVLWCAKPRYDGTVRLYSQVCMEIHLKSRATCALTHVNLGMIQSPDQLVYAFTDVMRFLCELFVQTKLPAHFLPREEDKQVGMGVIALANYLAHHQITYLEFVEAMEEVMNRWAITGKMPLYPEILGRKPLIHAIYLYKAFQAASKVADEYGIKRAFTIAPTVTSSYEYKDLRGFTTCAEISPPIADVETQIHRRTSDQSFRHYQYPHDVEIAGHDVDFALYYRLVKVWQRYMDATGKGHAISFNVWNDPNHGCDFSPEWLQDWYNSPLWSTYYSWSVDNSATVKTSIQTPVSAEDEDFWTVVDEPEYTCNIGNPSDCDACGG